jgi:hypothetical protein
MGLLLGLVLRSFLIMVVERVNCVADHLVMSITNAPESRPLKGKKGFPSTDLRRIGNEYNINTLVTGDK